MRSRRGPGPRRGQRQLQHDRARHPPLLAHERREQAARQGVLRHVAPPLARARPRSRWPRSRTACTPRAGWGRRCGPSTPSTSDPHWEQHLLEPEFWTRIQRRPRRRPLGRPPLAEGAAHPLRARARAPAVGPPRPLPGRAAHGGGPARPPRPHHRLRAPLRHLQARVPDPLRPRPPARAPRRRGASRAAHLRGQGPSRGPRGPGGDPPARRPDPGRVPGQARVPRGLRHRDRPRCSSRAATSGSTPRAAPRRPAAPAARRSPSTAASTSASSTAGGSRDTAATTAGPSASADVDPDTAVQDKSDAESLYRILTEEVVPRFFARDESGLPPPVDRRP